MLLTFAYLTYLAGWIGTSLAVKRHLNRNPDEYWLKVNVATFIGMFFPIFIVYYLVNVLILVHHKLSVGDK